MKPTLDIDVYFDLICPWCLIGKRHLTKALEQLRSVRPDIQTRISWHSLPLLPDIPPEGLPYQAFYERRLGGPAAVAARRAQVRVAGRLAGVKFAFDDIAVMPNTRAAHALIGHAARAGDEAQCERLIEALFAAYFNRGKDIGDLAVLLAIAAECGVSVSLQDIVSALPEQMANGSALGVSGVPYYVFNHRLALSGAQPPEMLCEAMQRSIG